MHFADWFPTLATLAIVTGCAPAQGPTCDGTLHATVTIEETSEALAVESVAPALIGSIATGENNDLIIIELESGEVINILFARPTAIGTPLPLGAELPDVQVRLGGTGVSIGGCETTATSEGELIVDHLHLDGEFLDCAIGSLRVRFTDCDAEFFGRPASETTFLVEIGR